MKSLSLDSPHAIIMVGIPGSGKSYFADKFARTFGAPYISEVEVQQYAKDDEATIHLIELMIEQATRTKKSLVLEVDSGSRTHRTALASALKAVGYKPLLVWVQVDEATAKARCAKSAQRTRSDYLDATQNFSPPHPQENALVISGKHTYATQARVVLKKLSSGRPPVAVPAPRQAATRGNITVR